MISKNDLIVIKYSHDREISAEYFAVQKFLMKNRKEKSKITENSVIDKYKFEILGEFAFLEYFCSELEKIFSKKTKLQWDITKVESGFRQIVEVKLVDLKTQKTIFKKLIDIITYSDKKISINEILGIENFNEPLSLTFDNIHFPKADFYIYIFIQEDGKILLAGYQGRIEINYYFSKNTIKIPITKLEKIRKLLSEFIQ